MYEALIQMTYLRDMVFAMTLSTEAKILKDAYWKETQLHMGQIQGEAEKYAYMLELENKFLGVPAADGINRVLAFDALHGFLTLTNEDLTLEKE